MPNTIIATVLQDAKYVRLMPNNPDVESFLMIDSVGSWDEIEAGTPIIILYEWPRLYFLDMLKFLDDMPVDLSNGVAAWIETAANKLIETYGMVSTREQSGAILKYWSETRYIFHPNRAEGEVSEH